MNSVIGIFKDKRIVIHTPTKEDFVDVVSYALELGYKWPLAYEIQAFLWNNYKEETCVKIYKHRIAYCDYDFYISRNITVFSMRWFFRERTLRGFV